MFKRLSSSFHVVSAVFCLLISLSSPSTAQTTNTEALESLATPTESTVSASAPAMSSFAADVKVKLEEASSSAGEISRLLSLNSDNDAELLSLKTQAEKLLSSTNQLSDELRAKLDDVTKRRTDLGPVPAADAAPEPAIVQSERAKLDAEVAEINAVLSESIEVKAEISKVSNAISDMRRGLFSRAVFGRTEISPSLLMTAGSSFVVEMKSVGNLFSAWISNVWSQKRLHLLGALGLSALAAILVSIGSAKLFGRRLQRSEDVTEPSYMTRLSVAFWSTLVKGVSVILFLTLTVFLMRSFGLMNGRVDPIIVTTLASVGFVYVVAKLTYAIFAPRKPQWRLVNVSNKGARFLSRAVILIAAINVTDYILDVISDVLSSSVVLTVAKGIVASTLIAIVLLVISFSRPRIGEGQTAESGNEPIRRSFAYGLRLAALVLLVSCLTGYIGFARFLSTQIVVTGAVLALMYIGFSSGKAISQQGDFAKSKPGQYLKSKHSLGDVALDQIGLLSGFSIYAIALLFGVPIILMSWGFQPGDIQSGLIKLFTGFTIGNFSLSLVSILTGIIIFGVGYMLTRWFQRWLDKNILVRSQVDSGVRNSVRTGIGYVGIVVATILGITSAGLDLSNLALVVSALSVGIGFGLQNIVQNFVSGVILLVERPFKVGDWVVAGATEGTVKRLSVRATEIETFRGQTIIVPNSEFINSPVGNWTHRNRIQRNEIPVSVAYESDPEKVIAVLLELIRQQPAVLRNPEPVVEFLGFGDFALNFELRFYLSDLSNGLNTRNAVRTAILKRFNAEGITFPYPTSDLNIHLSKQQASELLVEKMKAEKSDLENGGKSDIVS